MCTVYLITKCSCNQTQKPYSAISGKYSEKKKKSLQIPYIIMNNHSDSGLNLQQHRLIWKVNTMKRKFIHQSSCLVPPCCWRKFFLALFLWWKLFWSTQQRERQKPYQADVETNEKHHRISFTEAHVLNLTCTLMYTSTYCTCANTAKKKKKPVLHVSCLSPHARALLHLSVHLLSVLQPFCPLLELSLYILSLSFPQFMSSPLSVGCVEDKKVVSSCCEVKRWYSPEITQQKQ